MSRRPWLALLLVATFAAGVVFVVVRLLLPAPAPPVVHSPAGGALPALTRHLLFVVVDGLRYDIATDPGKMPGFASAMQRHTSGEMWAGQVTMTTSAVLSYATGQRGNLEQVARNVNPAPPPFDNWLASARRAGLRVVVAGDPAWVDMFGQHIDEARPDPEGVAIDVDFNPQTFRDTRELLEQRPGFMVAHFVTPDHQGHAYTLPSERYRAHIKDFDQQLFALLSELDSAWTVIVTSDHGALDSGTHGGDVAVARRVPVFAYGPGILAGKKLARPLDQADLAGTMATLLGLSPPAHSRGHVLVEWLGVSEEERARIACADAVRALAYADAALSEAEAAIVRQASSGCDAGGSASDRKLAAQRAVQALDQAIGARTGLASATSWLALLPLLALAVVIALLALGRRVLFALPLAFVLMGLAVGLTYTVERLPGAWPNALRITLFVLCNLGVLWLLLWPGRVASLLDRSPVLGALVIPGTLVASYTSNTQPESYVAVGITAILFVYLGRIEPGSGTLWRTSRPPVRIVAWLGLLAALVLLFPAGTRQVELYPAWLHHDDRFFALAVVTLIGLFWWGVREPHSGRRARVEALLFVLLIAGCLWWRRSAPPLLGRSAVMLFGAAALATALRGDPRRAVGFGLASYAWVSRDFELPVIIASLLAAEIVAGALCETPGRERSFSERLLLLTFLFGALYVQRIGITGALDFGAMDWGAAGFRDPHVPALVVGVALVYKYLLAALLLIGTLLWRLDRRSQIGTIESLVVTNVGRTGVLLLMLFVSGSSYWTALRVVGDLPFSLIGALAAGLFWIFAVSRPGREASSSRAKT